MPCTFSKEQQHALRNGLMALSFALSGLYRSPIFTFATPIEKKYLQQAQDALVRVRLAVEPCKDAPECELRPIEGGFW
jgi:hypothetical protein